jgi:hypothetical protein
MRNDFGQGVSEIRRLEAVGGKVGWGHGCLGNFPNAKRNVRHTFWSGLCLQLCQERGLEVRQLLQPDRISDEEIQFLEANLSRPGVACHRLADEIVPAML